MSYMEVIAKAKGVLAESGTTKAKPGIERRGHAVGFF
jgi:hypothetical protein